MKLTSKVGLKKLGNADNFRERKWFRCSAGSKAPPLPFHEAASIPAGQAESTNISCRQFKVK
jgi:hypothetical protein